MFGFFAKKLTEYSNHYVDWSRVGELVKSGKHRYNKDEIIIRGSIISITMAFALLGWYCNNKNANTSRKIALTLLSALFGFVTSHTVVIFPLIRKRQQMQYECDVLNTLIELQLTKINGNLTQGQLNAIKNTIRHVDNLSLSDEQHARASQTWGRRKNLLYKIHQILIDNDKDFWPEAIGDDFTNVINKLDQAPTNQTPNFSKTLKQNSYTA